MLLLLLLLLLLLVTLLLLMPRLMLAALLDGPCEKTRKELPFVIRNFLFTLTLDTWQILVTPLVQKKKHPSSC